MKGTESRTAA